MVKTCLLSIEGGDGLGVEHLIRVLDAESLDPTIFLQAVIQGSKCFIFARLWDVLRLQTSNQLDQLARSNQIIRRT